MICIIAICIYYFSSLQIVHICSIGTVDKSNLIEIWFNNLELANIVYVYACININLAKENIICD